MGDSTAPTIRDGDLPVVAASFAEAIHGPVVVGHTDDGLDDGLDDGPVVERDRKTEEGRELASDNPEYPSRPATGATGSWAGSSGAGPAPRRGEKARRTDRAGSATLPRGARDTVIFRRP